MLTQLATNLKVDGTTPVFTDILSMVGANALTAQLVVLSTSGVGSEVLKCEIMLSNDKDTVRRQQPSPDWG